MTEERATWLKRAGAALAGVVALALAFTAGRYSAPLQVEVREVEKEKLVFRELATEDLTRGMTFAKTVEKTVWRNVETRPDGTTIDRSIVHEGSRTDSTSSEVARRTEERAGEIEREKTSVTITTARPSWSLGLLVGATWTEPAFAPGAVTFGPLVDFRLGKTPVHVGGAALLEMRSGSLTRGTVALTGRAEF